MRVLVADQLVESALERLRDAGVEVQFDTSLSGDALQAALVEFDPHLLVVRSTRVERVHVEAAGQLSLVIRAGAGVNTIDLDACARWGVYVANCPGKNAAAVAELTMGLIISSDRKIPDNVADLRSARWNKRAYSVASGLSGRTLALLGVGRIGREVIQRALAFEMEIRAWSRSLTPEQATELGVTWCSTPEEAARDADVVSVHLAAAAETERLVGAAVFGAMRPGGLLVNTSRASVVDHEALEHAISERELRAALDVYPDEPKSGDGTFDHPLVRNERVYGTHHIGASTRQAQEAVADDVCRIVEHYRHYGEVINCVNLAQRSGADHCLVVRHRDRVGVLASVFQELRLAKINVQEMWNEIFSGGESACARIRIHGAPEEDVLDRIRAHPDIFQVVVLDHAIRGGNR